MTREAAAYLRRRVGAWPETAIVLGSAQASFADELADPVAIDFQEIPEWPAPSVPGHAGKLIVGEASGVPVTLISGRVHLYEGWTPQQVVFGVRVLGRLGLKRLILTNAAGGINPSYRRGLLVLITDHINLQGSNPLVGLNDAELGPRFPDMSRVYSPELCQKALAAASEASVELGQGVYAAMLGPSFETPAEIRFLRTIGADLAGMSTVPEAIAANHMGIQVLGISTVTNMASGMQAELSHEEVLETGRTSASALASLLRSLLPKLKA
ncbi:MAG TPA: purine-nucleoside phosphorylase [Bryobacteraceae bacterium]|nr:purine-nucleoside phosphorylase [Bryobacteraceae bacterium]HPT28153.1 purine-nucleoside phosphorylase [Bryobacteraceae bacterium]